MQGILAKDTHHNQSLWLSCALESEDFTKRAGHTCISHATKGEKAQVSRSFQAPTHGP